MQNITELKAQLEAVKEAAKQAMVEKLEAAKIKAEISKLSNDKLQDAIVRQQLKEQATARLEELEAICSSIVDSNPVFNNKTKQTREWNPSKRYGLGNQITILSGLLTGIQYSVKEHSELMLAATGLTSDLIESAVEAFGSLPYYSVNYDVLVEGTPANSEQLKTVLEIVCDKLEVTVDLSALTQANLDKQYNAAQVKAERMQAEAELTAEVTDFIIK